MQRNLIGGKKDQNNERETMMIINLFLCASTGDSVACTEGEDLTTLRECNVCRKSWQQMGCRASFAGNTVLECDQEISSIFAQVEQALKC